MFNNWALTVDQAGRPLEAERIYRRAIDISRTDSAEQGVSPMLLINYAATLRELGHLAEAADYAERGFAKARQADDQVVVNQSLLLRARIYRDRHDLKHAAEMLAEVEPRLRRNLPPEHYAFASLASEKALNAQAAGDLRTALDYSDQAVSMVEIAAKIGRQGAQFLPGFLLRRSSIELQGGRLDAAAADATRALSLMQKAAQPGVFSSTLGHAYLTLGRALQAQGKRNEARAAGRFGVEHLQVALGVDHADTRAARQLAELDSEAR